MKTKRQIVKWLEDMRDKAVRKVRTARCKEIELYEVTRDKELKIDETTDRIYQLVSQAQEIATRWVEDLDHHDGIDPAGYYVDSIIRKLRMDRADVRRYILSSMEDKTSIRVAINRRYDELTQNTRKAYQNTIAGVEACSSNKDAIKYLRSLGFDTTELEDAQPEKVTLIVPVDTNFLFLDKPE